MDGSFPSCRLSFMWLGGVCLVVGVNKVWGMHLVSGFPCIVHIQIPFPFDEVLKHSGPSEVLAINNMLHFIFFLPLEEVRWGPRIV
jgi:hypothetical protein